MLLCDFVLSAHRREKITVQKQHAEPGAQLESMMQFWYRESVKQEFLDEISQFVLFRIHSLGDFPWHYL